MYIPNRDPEDDDEGEGRKKEKSEEKKKGEEKHIPSHPYAQVYATTFSKPGSALNRR